MSLFPSLSVPTSQRTLSWEPPRGRGPWIRKVPGCLGHLVSAAELQLPCDLPSHCLTQAPGLRVWEKQGPGVTVFVTLVTAPLAPTL